MDKSCPICLNIIGETNCCITACNHSFCLSCLSISLQNNVSCPLCRNEIVPESKVITELKDELDDAYEETSNILDVLNEERERCDFYREQNRKIIYRYADIDEPLAGIHIKYINNKGPCIICGCKSELDEYGDRICHCDSCYKDGCCEMGSRWKSPWKEKFLR